MQRVLFKLSMPSNNSCNGKWTGDKKNYAITKNITNKATERLKLNNGEQSWYYSFGDGWTACITARIIQKGERLPKSDGFCGYNWMVEDIWLYGEIRKR